VVGQSWDLCTPNTMVTKEVLFFLPLNHCPHLLTRLILLYALDMGCIQVLQLYLHMMVWWMPNCLAASLAECRANFSPMLFESQLHLSRKE
jgi:hypothetical protein